jgi:hypothetical protein
LSLGGRPVTAYCSVCCGNNAADFFLKIVEEGHYKFSNSSPPLWRYPCDAPPLDKRLKRSATERLFIWSVTAKRGDGLSSIFFDPIHSTRCEGKLSRRGLIVVANSELHLQALAGGFVPPNASARFELEKKMERVFYVGESQYSFRRRAREVNFIATSRVFGTLLPPTQNPLSCCGHNRRRSCQHG